MLPDWLISHSVSYTTSMPRQTPAGRVRDVARAACRVFIEKGYRRTLMTDVGAHLELSHALLYRYVESKEALFELALLYAIDPESAATIAVPVPTPPPGHTFSLVEKWLNHNASFPILASAMARRRVTDPASEFLSIVDERFSFIENNRRLLALIEQSAPDLPDLQDLYFTKGRRRHLRQLASYLQHRSNSGHLRPISDVGVAARFIGETIAWFAWHRKADPDSTMIGDHQARQSVRELLLAAFVADDRSPSPVRQATRP